MPAPGRRRIGGANGLLLLCALLFVSSVSAAQAVLGLDLGTEYIKAALVKPGVPLDIVLTKDSKRKETAAIAFKALKSAVDTTKDVNFPERVYGGDAVALSARFPADVFPNLKSLLGLHFRDDIVSDYSIWHPQLSMLRSEEKDSVGIKSDSFVGEEEPFLVEELLAMEIQNVKSNAQTMAGKEYVIQDAVITVPSFYTVEERRAVSAAAELAGLRVLSLISDGLAVGLNYATSRQFPVVNEGGKPEIHLVYDMGAGSTTATVLKFQGRTVKDVGRFNKTIQEVQVLGTAWDRNLGGDLLNEVVANDMIANMLESKILQSVNANVRTVKHHGRTMAKLWKEAERLRQVLSANTETQTTMEGLYHEDFTFKYKLKRSDFESHAAPFAARVASPLLSALENAKLTMADIESVILHGGAVRTPMVQKELEAVVKDAEKIRTNVNSDEAAVFGAAFKAATLAPSFRVKEIRATDVGGHPVVLSWAIEGRSKQQKVFVPTSQANAIKQISFKNTEDFTFELSQQIAEPFRNVPVSSIKTENLTKSIESLTKLGCETSAIQLQFGLRLSPVDGLPEVVSGDVSCEVADTKKSGGVVGGVKDFLGFGKRDAQEPLHDDTEADDAEVTPSSDTSTSSSESKTSSTTSASAPTSSTDSKEPKKKTETVNISFTVSPIGTSTLSQKTLTRMKTRLSAFDASDRARSLREEALNTLEAYTYKVRDVLEDEAFVEVSTPEQRAEIQEKSSAASSWLYDEGADATQSEFKERLDELRKLVKPISLRKEEMKKRPEEIERLRSTLSQAASMAAMVANHIKEQEKAESAKEASQISATPRVDASKSAASDSSTATTSSEDDFASLEDDTSSTTATSTKSAKSSPTPEPDYPVYTEAELALLNEKEAAIHAWMDEKLAAQDGLSLTDEPAVLSTELAAKSKELTDTIMNLFTLKMNKQKAKDNKKSASGKKGPTPKKKVKTATVKPSASGDADNDDNIEELTIDVGKAAGATPIPDSSSSTGDEEIEMDRGGWEVPNGRDKEPLDDLEGMTQEEILEAALRGAGDEAADGAASSYSSSAKSKAKAKAKPTSKKDAKKAAAASSSSSVKSKKSAAAAAAASSSSAAAAKKKKSASVEHGEL